MSKKISAKRIEIVSLKQVRESSIMYKDRKITSPKDSAMILSKLINDCDRENFLVLCVDTKNQPTLISTVSVGSLNASIVNPREIFKVAILSNSKSIILAHNHPSGDPSPSAEDIDITRRLGDAGEIVDIRILDHIIIGREGTFFSFKENNLL